MNFKDMLKLGKVYAEKMLPFQSDNSGIQFTINVVTGLVAVVIALLVGALILSKIAPQIVGTDATSNSTIATIVAAGYGALGIASVLPYIIVAGAAIALVVIYFSGQKKE